MLNRLLIVGLIILLQNSVFSQRLLISPSVTPSASPPPSAVATFPPAYPQTVTEYYSSIDPAAKGDALKLQLQQLISPHRVLTYDQVWDAFPSVDIYLPGYPCDSNSSHIPDIYSSYCWAPEKNLATGGECGNYKKEGDCYNREHIWPKSWFGGFDYGDNAQTDLFELWPSDGYVNGLRGDLPLGSVDVKTLTYNSTNGCMIGTCAAGSSYGKCFEVTSKLKGDVARSYFYLSTAYWNSWECCDEVAVDGSDMKSWMEDEMRNWHKLDPVDDNEVQRNNVIYNKFQGNRNPFIDYPQWVDAIGDF